MKPLIAAVVAVSVSAWIPAAKALDLTDVSKAPAGFAREVEMVGSNGKPEKSIVFGTGTYTVPPQMLDQILSAYGIQLVDASKLPAWYARELEVVGSDGKPQKSLVFGTVASTIPPQELDRILAAYGVQLVDAAKVPAGYARETEGAGADGKPVKTLIFGTSSSTLAPQVLHQILSGYR